MQRAESRKLLPPQFIRKRVLWIVTPVDNASDCSFSLSGLTDGTPLTLQNISTAPLTVLYDEPPSPVREIVTYSKEVQTSEAWTGGDGEDDGKASHKTDEELRERIRQEIVEELKQLKATDSEEQDEKTDGTANGGFFVRELSDEEKAAITASEEFVDFIERSSKVVERALDIEYDVLADYGLGVNGEDEEQAGRKLKEVVQFYDERWSKKRMISDINYSPKVLVFGSEVSWENS